MKDLYKDWCDEVEVDAIPKLPCLRKGSRI